MVGTLLPYRHRRAGIRQMAKTKNDMARNTAEATMPDSTGNLETTPLQETDGCLIMRSKMEELTVRLVAEPCH